MTTRPAPTSTGQPAPDPTLEERIERLRATCARLDDDLVGVTLTAPSRRSGRLLQELQARLQAVQGAATTAAPPTPSWTPADDATVDDVAFPETSAVAINAPPATAPTGIPVVAAAPNATPAAAASATATPGFTVLVSDAPPAGAIPTTSSTTTTRAKAAAAKNKKPTTKAATTTTAPSLRPGALLHGILMALSAAATATPLTLGLALTTTLTALFAGARRGLWSRLTQLAGLGTIASVVAALWPLGERLGWRRPVSDDELLLALPQALLALQALRLAWRARGRSTPPAPATPATTATTTATAATTAATTATTPPTRPGLIGLAVVMVTLVAVDLGLLLLAMGPVWSWLWRSSRGWLALALLVVAVVDHARGRRGLSGLVAVGLGIAVAVVLGLGAWNLRFAMFHDVFSLARVIVAAVVVLLTLSLLVRVIRRPPVAKRGPA